MFFWLLQIFPGCSDPPVGARTVPGSKYILADISDPLPGGPVLKGIVPRDFLPQFFFHQTDPPETLIHGLKSFCRKFFFCKTI